MHTGNVTAMDTQTLTTLIGMAGFTLALFGYLATMKRDLKTDMSTQIAATNARIDELRTDMRTGFASVDQRLAVLEQRTYDLKRDAS